MKYVPLEPSGWEDKQKEAFTHVQLQHVRTDPNLVLQVTITFFFFRGGTNTMLIDVG